MLLFEASLNPGNSFLLNFGVKLIQDGHHGQLTFKIQINTMIKMAELKTC